MSGTANDAASGGEIKPKNVILDRWAAVLAAKGARAAILGPDGRIERTFGDIEREAEDIAAKLSGLPPGFVASLQARNGPSWPALLLAIWRAGGCAMLVDATLPDAARNAAERRCGARARLGARDGEVFVEPLENPAAGLGVISPDLIKLTSGTTGEPSAILFTARQIEADCDNVCETMGIAETDLNYGVVAFSHSYGFSNLVTPLLCRGVPAAAAADVLPRAVLDGLTATRATVLPAVPAIFQALSALEATLPALRLCISAGAPLRARTAADFRARFGVKVHTFYGASECGGICYDAAEDDLVEDGFVGPALRGVDLDLGDGDEIAGWRLRVRSAAVGLGELGGVAPDGCFEPADRVVPARGGWKIVGRDSDMINVAGRKVSPVEVERTLLRYPGVAEVVVFGVPDASRGEAAVAWVVPRGAVNADDLARHCADALAAWQAPREICFVDALPVNARGKISRRHLRAAHLGRTVQPG